MSDDKKIYLDMRLNFRAMIYDPDQLEQTVESREKPVLVFKESDLELWIDNKRVGKLPEGIFLERDVDSEYGELELQFFDADKWSAFVKLLKQIIDDPLREERKKEEKEEIPCTPVSSSNIQAVGYDEKTSTLRIKFNGGGVFDYPRVPKELHNWLLKQESIGRAFHSRIRNQFGHKRLQ